MAVPDYGQKLETRRNQWFTANVFLQLTLTTLTDLWLSNAVRFHSTEWLPIRVCLRVTDFEHRTFAVVHMLLYQTGATVSLHVQIWNPKQHVLKAVAVELI